MAKRSAEYREIQRGLSQIGMMAAAARKAGVDLDPIVVEQRAALRHRLKQLQQVFRARRKARKRAMVRELKPAAGPRLSVTKTVHYQYDAADNSRLEEFYASREWKLLRYEALRKHGGRCQCCGASPEEGKRLNVDHIFPVRVYWDLRLDINNLQVLCEDCNEGKGARHADDWRFEPSGA